MRANMAADGGRHGTQGKQRPPWHPRQTAAAMAPELAVSKLKDHQAKRSVRHSLFDVQRSVFLGGVAGTSGLTAGRVLGRDVAAAGGPIRFRIT